MGADNGQKEKIVVQSPANCRGCNATTEEIKKQYGGWLVYPINPGVAIYMCPNCSAVQGNPNAFENEQRMEILAKNFSADRIIRPESPRIVPAFRK